MSLGLCIASWTCFAIAAAMLRTPSPLLLALVPGHFVLGIAAFLTSGGRRWALLLNALLLAVNWSFLFWQTYLN